MATYLFRIIDNARDPLLVLGDGADQDTAQADAESKWDAVVTEPDRLPRMDVEVVAMTGDAPEFEPAQQKELVV